jgi:DNA-binding beta-propeller fold protein YncE
VTTICDIKAPSGVVVTANGTILVASCYGNNILKISKPPSTKFLSILVIPSLSPPPNHFFSLSHLDKTGSGAYGIVTLAGTGAQGSVDGTASECSFFYPEGIAVDEQTSTCFVADYGNSRIRKISLV